MRKSDASGKLRGMLHGRAFASPRESVVWAVNALVEDLISSLETRLQMVVEEAEDGHEGDWTSGLSTGEQVAAATAIPSPTPTFSHIPRPARFP